MAYPSFNDREFDLLKKITENTAELATGGGSGTPGGSNGQVQYNNAGAFGGLNTTGTGDVVKNVDPTLDGFILTGSERVTASAIVATEIDVTLPETTVSLTSSPTLTFSATPAAGTKFWVTLNADGTQRTATIPSSYSINRQGNITSVVVPASGTVVLLFRRTASRWEVFGDPISDDLKTYTVGFTSDGGGSAIATGKVKGFATAKASGTIRAWTHTVDAGTPVIEVWKIASGTAKPTAANAINSVGVGVTTGTSVYSTDLSDFTTAAVAKGDIFAFSIKSNTGSATEMSFGLEIVIS